MPVDNTYAPYSEAGILDIQDRDRMQAKSGELKLRMVAGYEWFDKDRAPVMPPILFHQDSDCFGAEPLKLVRTLRRVQF